MGIRRLYTRSVATGNSDKLIIELLNPDKSVTTYTAKANQIDGKTEQELNTSMDVWLAFNGYEDYIGTIGVHLNRDGSLCVWTGIMPSTFPEDEVNP